MFKKLISIFLSFTLIFTQSLFAQGVAQLNLGSYLSTVGRSISTDRFRPLHMRYFSYDLKADNFQLLLDKGDNKDIKEPELEEKTKVLMEYFQIGLSLPNDKFWVNLRPDAQDEMINPELEKTDMGKIMLEADLQLKRDTAQATSPQTPEGKAYWDKLYKKAGELFGTENITIPTITRPWIVPGEVILRQGEDSAYIFKANMKVLLEEDYLSSQPSAISSQQYNFKDPRMKELNQYSTQLIRELILPKLTKEVNTSKRYAALRQVFFSLVMARWFKDKCQGVTRNQSTETRENSYIKLIDSGSLNNLTSKEAWSKSYYFNEYKKSFEKGEYNLKEVVATPTGQVIRSYVSGGVVMNFASNFYRGSKKLLLPVLFSLASLVSLSGNVGGSTADELFLEGKIADKQTGISINQKKETIIAKQSKDKQYSDYIAQLTQKVELEFKDIRYDDMTRLIARVLDDDIHEGGIWDPKTKHYFTISGLDIYHDKTEKMYTVQAIVPMFYNFKLFVHNNDIEVKISVGITSQQKSIEEEILGLVKEFILRHGPGSKEELVRAPKESITLKEANDTYFKLSTVYKTRINSLYEPRERIYEMVLYFLEGHPFEGLSAEFDSINETLLEIEKTMKSLETMNNNAAKEMGNMYKSEREKMIRRQNQVVEILKAMLDLKGGLQQLNEKIITNVKNHQHKAIMLKEANDAYYNIVGAFPESFRDLDITYWLEHDLRGRAFTSLSGAFALINQTKGVMRVDIIYLKSKSYTTRKNTIYNQDPEQKAVVIKELEEFIGKLQELNLKIFWSYNYTNIDEKA